MNLRSWPVSALMLLAVIVLALNCGELRAQLDDTLGALDGEWIFVEDETEGRVLQQLTPPISSLGALLP
jgi:hypothetical protein